MIGMLLYFYMAAFFWDNPWKAAIPFADSQPGTVPVELAGSIKHPGVYYLPADATVAAFFRKLNLPLPADCPEHFANRRLTPGMAIVVEQDRSIRLGEMPAGKRLALDIPLDINRVALEDLILIPGIKEATAEKILSFRQAMGGRIERMEDLLQVPGIKARRLQELKKHLHVSILPAKALKRSVE